MTTQSLEALEPIESLNGDKKKVVTLSSILERISTRLNKDVSRYNASWSERDRTTVERTINLVNYSRDLVEVYYSAPDDSMARHYLRYILDEMPTLIAEDDHPVSILETHQCCIRLSKFVSDHVTGITHRRGFFKHLWSNS